MPEANCSQRSPPHTKSRFPTAPFSSLLARVLLTRIGGGDSPTGSQAQFADGRSESPKHLALAAVVAANKQAVALRSLQTETASAIQHSPRIGWSVQARTRADQPQTPRTMPPIPL